MRFIFLLLFSTVVSIYSGEKLNVLFIIVDDLNDMPLKPQGKPLVPTPHIDSLAESGVNFTNAHCNDPICAPSRTSMMFGLYPQTTGLYWFEGWRKRNIFKHNITLPEYFQKNGYETFGTGKIFHGRHDMKGIGTFGINQSFGPHPVDGIDKFMSHHSSQDELFEEFPDMPYKWEQTFGPMSEAPDWSKQQGGKKGWQLYGKPWKYNNDEDRDLFPDEMSVDWCKEILKKEHQKPFMLFAGLVRTHTPLYAPKKYFDMFPLDKIAVPAILKDDLKDCAKPLANKSRYGFVRYQFLKQGEDKNLLLKKWLQAYMACVAFIDDQVGELISALKKSEYAENTIVVFTSDHGFHIGDKEFLYKQSLWDGSTRVPYIISGVKSMKKGAVCNNPVSLIDLFPTLNDLCGLPIQPEQNKTPLDGHSVKPFLFNPESTEWAGPDVTITTLPGKDHMQFKKHEGALRPHFSVRSKHFRYTLCSNGEEELYDFKNDPYEWHNLAQKPEYKSKVQELKQKLIALRDGKNWQEIDENISIKGLESREIAEHLKNYELNFSIKTNSPKLEANVRSSFQLPSPKDPQKWNDYRIMVDGHRVEVWINGKLVSDTIVKGKFNGSLMIKHSKMSHETQIRNLRFRSI